jgi:hypothetical protein
MRWKEGGKFCYTCSLGAGKIWTPDKLAQAVTCLSCIREVLGSNVGRGTDYPYGDFQ